MLHLRALAELPLDNLGDGRLDNFPLVTFNFLLLVERGARVILNSVGESSRLLRLSNARLSSENVSGLVTFASTTETLKFGLWDESGVFNFYYFTIGGDSVVRSFNNNKSIRGHVQSVSNLSILRNNFSSFISGQSNYLSINFNLIFSLLPH